MMPQYTIEYAVQFRKHAQPLRYNTDDPVAAEEFLTELLERGYPLKAIRHDGADLPQHDFDKMVKTAAGMLAARHVCASLSIKPEEERFRFGFAA